VRGRELTALSALAIAAGLLIAGDKIGPVFIGCLAGVFTGLVPGLHYNTFLPYLTGSAFIIGLAVSHSFFDFVPAILLGAPDESAALAVLPSHKMLLRGRGLEAFRITIIAGLLATLIALPLTPLFSFIAEAPVLVPLVLVFCIALMARQKHWPEAIAIMASSAMLGYAAFETAGGLGAMLAGFFGVSTILLSLWTRPHIPAQRPVATARVSAREAGLAAVAGWLSGLFPAVSSSVAAMAVSPRMNHRKFLAVLGGTNTVYVFAAIAAMHVVGRPHSAAGLALVSEKPSLLFIVGAALAAAGFSAWLAWQLSRTIVTTFNRFDYRWASAAALIVIVALTALSGLPALAILMLSTLVGLACPVMGVRRNTCMASLLIPVLLYYVL